MDVLEQLLRVGRRRAGVVLNVHKGLVAGGAETGEGDLLAGDAVGELGLAEVDEAGPQSADAVLGNLGDHLRGGRGEEEGGKLHVPLPAQAVPENRRATVLGQ